MGVIKQGILGGVQNKVGSVVGTSWKGIAVLKALPLSVANPNTAGQVTQRTAFSLASKIGSLLLANLLKPFWDRFAQKMSGYNSWVKTNVEFMLDGVISDYSLLIMSKGKLSAATTFTVAGNSGTNTITLTASAASLNQFSATSDIAVGVVYNETQDYWTVTSDLGARSASPYTATDSKMVAADVLHAWIQYKRADLSYVSDSTYATAVVS